MARTIGSVGLVKREFEQDFWRRCRQLKLKPGAYLAEIIHNARAVGDSKTGLAALAVSSRMLPDDPAPLQQSLPMLVVERYEPQPNQVAEAVG